MEDIKTLDADLYYSAHRVIIKRLEPYHLLERTKKHFDVRDFTFDGRNKFEIKEKFLSEFEELSKSVISFGLYMKNVNKFYLFTLRENVDSFLDEAEVLDELKNKGLVVLHKVLLEKEFGFSKEELVSQDGIQYIQSVDEAFDLIDLGQAEASFIIPIQNN